MKQMDNVKHKSQKKKQKQQHKQELSSLHTNDVPAKLKMLRFIPAAVWMGVIFYLSSKTGDELNTVLPFIQRYLPFIADFNWGHYISYFILAMTFDFAFAERSNRWRYKGIIIILCTLYGVTDELHQYFVGGRMMDIMDIRNDFIGALLWTLIIKVPSLYYIWKKLYRII